LPQDAQVKLLRVLQQHEVEPVGAGKAVPINVRIISATNRNLKQEVREGRFREDLYFRLDVLSMRVPSLRERAEDIPTLARYFIEQFSVTDNLPIKELTPEAERELAENPWPGNVRMLQNTIRRAMILSEGQRIDAEDLRAIQEVESENIGEQMPAMMKARHMISLLDEKGYFKPVETIEAEAMREVLVYTDYNVTRAADAIGMAKSTFYKKMTQYGIKP
jgi:DNA-binding NtrC family response regulator